LIRERDRAIKRAETLEAEVWALGVQVVAQKARLKLASEVIEAMRLFDHRKTDAALARWDNVPGDDARLPPPPVRVATAPYGVPIPTYRDEQEIKP
jgi:hypothetical protein